MATIYLHPSVNTPQAVEAIQNATGRTAMAAAGNRIVLVPTLSERALDKLAGVIRVRDYINNNY